MRGAVSPKRFLPSTLRVSSTPLMMLPHWSDLHTHHQSSITNVRLRSTRGTMLEMSLMCQRV